MSQRNDPDHPLVYTACMNNQPAYPDYFTPATSVAKLLRDYPQTIPVFLEFHMDCVGCSMASFEKIGDAARIYHVPAALFFQSLIKAITPEEQ